jgi:hypothetical protein
LDMSLYQAGTIRLFNFSWDCKCNFGWRSCSASKG